MTHRLQINTIIYCKQQGHEDTYRHNLCRLIETNVILKTPYYWLVCKLMCRKHHVQFQLNRFAQFWRDYYTAIPLLLTDKKHSHFQSQC